MVFYLLDDIKKRFGRQLYSLLAVAALSIGTLVLGGVLIFNIVHKEPIVNTVPEGGIDVSSREAGINEVETGHNDSETSPDTDGPVYEVPPEKNDQAGTSSEEHVEEEMPNESVELFSVGDKKRP